ncbi:MAG: serine/threonine-protein kinase [Planctomycetota bacterium]|nr:serine/threonine-protein kinase [Planctomycetota bacterium]
MSVFELVAIGLETGQQWRRALAPNTTILIGRHGEGGAWEIPWDRRISRQHAELVLEGAQLRVRCLESARNSILFRGKKLRQVTVFPGEDFGIGRTLFRVEHADHVPTQEGGLAQPVLDLESQLGLPSESPSLTAAHVAHVVDGGVFGNYDLIDQISRGGSGQLLKAVHRHLKWPAAIKLLSREAASSAEELARFRNKMQVLARLQHPNVICVHDAGELHGMRYLVMEFVDGRNLVSRLKEQTLEVPAAVDVILQAARGLRHAHAHKIVHRNVNPGHLMITRRGTIKVVGWSLALRRGETVLAARDECRELVGTLDYMAPEQTVDSDQVDPRADIYSLGCTLFAILTRRVVYPVDWFKRKLLAQRHQPAPTLQELRPDVPDALEAVYQRMMAKSRGQRYPSMDDVIAALQQSLGT